MLKVSFINVGYGESILLETGGEYSGTRCRDFDPELRTGPNSHSVILIDGGSGEDEEYTGNTGRIRTKDYLAKKGIDTLDLAIVTHAHEDHVCGLEQFAAAGGKIKKLYTVRKLPQNRRELAGGRIQDKGTCKFIAALNSYSRLLRLMEKQGTVVTEIDGNTDTLKLTADLDAEIMAPSFENAEELYKRFTGLYRDAQDPAFKARAETLAADLNDYSLALMLCYKGSKFFLPSDATPARLFSDTSFRSAFKAGRLQAKALKLAHHGQADSVNESFINAISPSVVVTCASSDRRYQSADPSVYAQIEDSVHKKDIKPVFLFTDYIQPNVRDHSAGPRQSVEITLDGETISYCYSPALRDQYVEY